MGRTTVTPLPSLQRRLTAFGDNLRMARLRRRLSATQVASRLPGRDRASPPDSPEHRRRRPHRRALPLRKVENQSVIDRPGILSQSRGGTEIRFHRGLVHEPLLFASLRLCERATRMRLCSSGGSRSATRTGASGRASAVSSSSLLKAVTSP